MERKIRIMGLEVAYDSESDARQKLNERRAVAVIATPSLSKDTVMKNAMAGKRFPCKTTRHILPARPMGIRFPLKFLYGGSLFDANNTFIDTLNKRSLKLRPPRSMIDDTIYDEPMFLFE